MSIDRKQVNAEMKELFGKVPSWAASLPDSAVGGFWELMRDFQLGETQHPEQVQGAHRARGLGRDAVQVLHAVPHGGGAACSARPTRRSPRPR